MYKLKNKLLNAATFKNNRYKATTTAKTIILGLLIISIVTGIVYVILSPIISIVTDSFKSLGDVYNPLVFVFPQSPTLLNFKHAIKYMDYYSSLVTTLIMTVVLMLIQVLITSVTGYGFARFKFPGRSLLFGFVIFTIVLPPQTIMVPMYTQFRFFDFLGLFTLLGGEPLGLINTFVPVTVLTTFGVGLRAGLYIFIFRQFFRGLPKEIEEAAFIDGANTLYTYLRVMLPNAVPAIVTVMMLSFVWQYNDTYYASTFMNRLNLIAIKLGSVGQTFSVLEMVFDPNYVKVVTNAAIVLGIVPVVVFYLVLQRYFMEGIERSGIVG